MDTPIIAKKKIEKTSDWTGSTANYNYEDIETSKLCDTSRHGDRKLNSNLKRKIQYKSMQNREKGENSGKDLFEIEQNQKIEPIVQKEWGGARI